MRAQRKETRERMGPTPLLPTPAEDIVTKGAPISDNDSLVSSVYSQHSEPEGEFRDNDDYDGFVHIPQPPLAPNIINEGARPNLVPEGDEFIHAPEGAAVPPAPNIGRPTHDPTCQYPPARWIQGADGRMERVNFCELRRMKAMGKLNQEMFALTLGSKQIPPYANTMSKKCENRWLSFGCKALSLARKGNPMIG
jgi:hypothetical protein